MAVHFPLLVTALKVISLLIFMLRGLKPRRKMYLGSHFWMRTVIVVTAGVMRKEKSTLLCGKIAGGMVKEILVTLGGWIAGTCLLSTLANSVEPHPGDGLILLSRIANMRNGGRANGIPIGVLTTKTRMVRRRSRTEKSNSGMNGDISISKGSIPVCNHKKDEDQVRPWRPSFIQSRSRGEAPPQHNPSNKFIPSFSYGRGSAEADPAKLPISRDKTASDGSSFGRAMLGVEKGDDDHGDSSILRCSRMKLLNIYPVINSRSSQSLKVGLVQVPPLTQDELSEPLALSAPDSEELVCGMSSTFIKQESLEMVIPDPKLLFLISMQRPRTSEIGVKVNVRGHVLQRGVRASACTLRGFEGFYTNFLEYCLKQSRSEAEMLLVENLESLDPDHKFIDKFLNYKDLLPADVFDMAFQSRNDGKAAALGAGEMSSNETGLGRNHQDSLVAADELLKGGGKKKGKKGKKVSPLVLGFNVVSNRIMMGEIQTIDE